MTQFVSSVLPSNISPQQDRNLDGGSLSLRQASLDEASFKLGMQMQSVESWLLARKDGVGIDDVLGRSGMLFHSLTSSCN